MSTGRLTSFSDGVIAVAITLLVLDLQVPGVGRHSLGHDLLAQWPEYVAFAISFTTIGIIWINHHAQIGRLAAADHGVLMLNLLLLMTICVIPFATKLMAQYLKLGRGEHLAAGVYGGVLLAMALAFSAVNRYILFHRPHLMRIEMSEAQRRLIFRRALSGVVPYLMATLLAIVSPYLTLGLTGALAAFYALPFAAGRDVESAGLA